jgi:hypothetical protein
VSNISDFEKKNNSFGIIQTLAELNVFFQNFSLSKNKFRRFSPRKVI